MHSSDAGDVIGCVYSYPPRGGAGSAESPRQAAVRSWVRVDRSALDPLLYDAVRAWLEHAWPFRSIEYAPRT